MTQLVPLDQPAVTKEELECPYKQVGLLHHTLSVFHFGADQGIFSVELKTL